MFRSIAVIIEIAILVVVLQLPFVQYCLRGFARCNFMMLIVKTQTEIRTSMV